MTGPAAGGTGSSAHNGGSSVATADGQQILFRLFDSLRLGPCPSPLLVTYEGARYLSVTPLLETKLPAEEEEEGEEGED